MQMFQNIHSFFSFLLLPCRVGSKSLDSFFPLLPCRVGSKSLGSFFPLLPCRVGSKSLGSFFPLLPCRVGSKSLGSFFPLLPCRVGSKSLDSFFPLLPCRVGSKSLDSFFPLLPCGGGGGGGPSHLVASSPCSLAGWGPSHLVASSTFIVNALHLPLSSAMVFHSWLFIPALSLFDTVFSSQLWSSSSSATLFCFPCSLNVVENTDPRIISLTKSWANKDIADAELGLRGYIMLAWHGLAIIIY